MHHQDRFAFPVHAHWKRIICTFHTDYFFRLLSSLLYTAMQQEGYIGLWNKFAWNFKITLHKSYCDMQNTGFNNIMFTVSHASSNVCRSCGALLCLITCDSYIYTATGKHGEHYVVMCSLLCTLHWLYVRMNKRLYLLQDL